MATSRPLVVACVGDSAGARLAAAVAARLERLGLADGARGAGRPERCQVVALEGCRRDCAARSLRARGVRVWRSVRVDDLSEGRPPDAARLAEQVAAVLRARRPGTAVRYLRALLAQAPRGATAASVARTVGVTRPAAGETLIRLCRRGLVTRRPDRTFALTTAGVAAARAAVRRQRIAERFLADFAGYPTGDVRGPAARIAEGLPDDVAERLFERLGSPARCPHGLPIE